MTKLIKTTKYEEKSNFDTGLNDRPINDIMGTDNGYRYGVR